MTDIPLYCWCCTKCDWAGAADDRAAAQAMHDEHGCGCEVIPIGRVISPARPELPHFSGTTPGYRGQ